MVTRFGKAVPIWGRSATSLSLAGAVSFPAPPLSKAGTKANAIAAVQPRLEPVPEDLRVVVAGHEIAQTVMGYRVVGATRNPLYYLPPTHVDVTRLHPSERRAETEWGGRVAYFHILTDDGLIPDAVWFHPEPPEAFAAIRNYMGFFPQVVDEAWVGTTRVATSGDAPDGGWALRRQ